VSAAPPHAHVVRPRIRFTLPQALAATEPPEARGLARDAVRLLVGRDVTGRDRGEGIARRIEHARFRDLGRFLAPGDLLVVNTSATRAAAVDGEHDRLGPVVVHFSTDLDDDMWVIELRSAPAAARSIRTAREGDHITLPNGVTLTLTAFPQASDPADGSYPGAGRLWRVETCGSVREVLRDYGRAIRYGYVAHAWPLPAYQTVFADPADRYASAEMPSAARPFSLPLVARLREQGVGFATIALHAGVSSPEYGEPPTAERYVVPPSTAADVNRVRARGGRVIAVGTTVTRALETVCDQDGVVHAGRGWTDLVLHPDRPVLAVDGLVTGLHDPDASHLLLLEAVAGADLVQRVYDAALDQRYLWHEFGDSCLLLPRRAI
jgi:S-adenosylmethionine:tRNA ribosyltransferase-isomerase